MKKIYKKAISLAILSGIETGFFFISNDKELFFMVWGILWLVFILNSSRLTNLSVFRAIGSMTDDANYANMAGTRAEIECIPEEIRRKRPFQVINIVYVILLVLNVIAYITVVTIKY